MIRLALFSLVAAAFATAAGTMFTALAAVILSLLRSGLGPGEMIAAFLLGGPFVLMFSVGVMLHILPVVAPAAVMLGGLLWAMGEKRPSLRRRLPWAAAGAPFGVVYGLAMGGLLPGAEGVMDSFFPDKMLQGAAFAIGGSGAALAYRAAMRAFGLFFPPPESDEAP